MAEREKKVSDGDGQMPPEGRLGLPSTAETVESKPAVHEVPTQAAEVVPQATPTMASAASPATTRPVTQPKDELTEEIEHVLSEDLEDLYEQLPKNQQKKFKEEGERTASLITQMIVTGMFHTKKILGLIRRWLQLIPGVNRFFLEQESKIKTDRILMIEEERKQK